MIVKPHYVMRKILFGTIFYFFIFCCSDLVSPESGEIVYSNSFETESDFEGWEGIGPESRRNDVPNRESKNSVYISGGCVVPHAFFVFDVNLPQGYYMIECWGKAVPRTFGGSVSLKYKIDENFNYSSVFIGFSDSIWTFKKSDTLFFDKSNNLRIEMNAGGFFSSAMLIDDLIVKKVNE